MLNCLLETTEMEKRPVNESCLRAEHCSKSTCIHRFLHVVPTAILCLILCPWIFGEEAEAQRSKITDLRPSELQVMNCVNWSREKEKAAAPDTWKLARHSLGGRVVLSLDIISQNTDIGQGYCENMIK